MGVTYKLKSEIINFILETKKADPKISCRGMASLVEAKFQIKLSKSSINALFKQSGLSQPVGRRRTKRKYTLRFKGLIATQAKELALPTSFILPTPPEPEITKPIELLGPMEVEEAEAKAKIEAEEKARQEAEEKARREAEEQAKAEAEAKAKAEAEEKARLIAQLKAEIQALIKEKEEIEAEVRLEAERAKAEKEAKAKVEKETKARLAEHLRRELESLIKEKEEFEAKLKIEKERIRKEAEEQAKKEAEERARQEAEARAKAEAEAKARQEAEERARKEAEERARYEAEERARKEAEERARQEAEEFAKIQPEIVQIEGEFLGLGAIFLKAADYLVGGSHRIVETIKTHLPRQEKDILSKTESLIYLSLFELNLGEDSGLWPLINKKIAQKDISLYFNYLQNIHLLSTDVLLGITFGLFQEVRGSKVNLADGTYFYLDGQLHTVWSVPQLPYNFATTIYNIKNYIKKSLLQADSPFVLFMAPGYEIPTGEFFDFLEGFLATEEKRTILSLTLYNHKYEEIETLHFKEGNPHYFIFGLWPWQFGEYRKASSIGEFKPFYFAGLKKDFYLADLEIELMQPTLNKKLTLRGCALKTQPQEKARLLILSNLAPEKMKAQALAETYLGHWPNLEETFEDFSRKVELFTYTASASRFFSLQNIKLDKETTQEIRGFFDYYLAALDLYVRWNFLPLGYEEETFLTTRERFYSLPGEIKKEDNLTLLTFKPPKDYPYLKDLEYACRRVNEKEIILNDGSRLWLLV